MAGLTIYKKKNKHVDIKKKLKQTRYGCMLIQEIDTSKVFQIAGDITIDIRQLLDRDHLNAISSWNDFIKVKEVRKFNQSQLIEVYLDSDIEMRSDISLPLRLLKSSQQKELLHLANLIEEYQSILIEKQKQDTDLIFRQQIQKLICSQEPISQLDCDEFHGWNFRKSVEKAEKVINQIKQQAKDSDDHFYYVLFKGNKYDQTKCRLGYTIQNLRDFLCLNSDQIDYISLRKPIIFNYKYYHQYTEYLFNRINNSIRLLKQDKSDLDYFRSGLNFLREETLDIFSVDNLSVRIKQVQYLYVLSNYKSQMDDILWVSKWLPVNGQQPSQVLQAQRNLKKDLNEEQEKTKSNPLFDGSIYTDVIYEAQSEIFREKFYSIIDNNLYHDILESL
ncbi:hypothetical protein TTHERM_00753410 (macronuclear) [Tetrahymena thermophila SB210]|uniref:Uncharacterized protein n=1 Tax=Tetrahymena thermophila (strain SB210) TaxID=312017 RepID=Q23NH9_TETTS|nr:hypothetical protein TTHERM_00753410 [Tetrahymena thermophila SB210]EAR98095.1 hypothetical protein TTHERM_00753410 [Tetrahymena thermophila SB210]|eukprot:XP_001018340.1 hypothetical protein TTHERM_00753410 [Tetrahymena thermophila SB210]